MITIENNEMQIREYNGQRVVTFKDIDTVHQRPTGTAGRNFRKNKKHFIENVDFCILTREKSNGRNSSIESIEQIPPKSLTLITESGYLMIVKSFTDDLSWEVQRKLVNIYFRNQEIVADARQTLPLSSDEIVDWKLNDLHKRLKALEQQVVEKPKIGVLHRLKPKSDTWYERNRNKIWKIRYEKDIELKELYSIILEECSKYYDLDEAEKIYKSEKGYKPVYPIDLVEHFRQLEDIANQVLDYFES